MFHPINLGCKENSRTNPLLTPRHWFQFPLWIMLLLLWIRHNTLHTAVSLSHCFVLDQTWRTLLTEGNCCCFLINFLLSLPGVFFRCWIRWPKSCPLALGSIVSMVTNHPSAHLCYDCFCLQLQIRRCTNWHSASWMPSMPKPPSGMTRSRCSTAGWDFQELWNARSMLNLQRRIFRCKASLLKITAACLSCTSSHQRYCLHLCNCLFPFLASQFSFFLALGNAVLTVCSLHVKGQLLWGEVLNVRCLRTQHCSVAVYCTPTDCSHSDICVGTIP